MYNTNWNFDWMSREDQKVIKILAVHSEGARNVCNKVMAMHPTGVVSQSQQCQLHGGARRKESFILWKPSMSSPIFVPTYWNLSSKKGKHWHPDDISSRDHLGAWITIHFFHCNPSNSCETFQSGPKRRTVYNCLASHAAITKGLFVILWRIGLSRTYRDTYFV